MPAKVLLNLRQHSLQEKTKVTEAVSGVGWKEGFPPFAAINC